MAATQVQTILPQEFTPLIEEIRSERAKKLEDTSNISIIKDAVKLLHKTLVNK